MSRVREFLRRERPKDPRDGSEAEGVPAKLGVMENWVRRPRRGVAGDLLLTTLGISKTQIPRGL